MPAINKKPVMKRFLYIFNKKSIFNILDVVFGEIF